MYICIVYIFLCFLCVIYIQMMSRPLALGVFCEVTRIYVCRCMYMYISMYTYISICLCVYIYTDDVTASGAGRVW